MSVYITKSLERRIEELRNYTFQGGGFKTRPQVVLKKPLFEKGIKKYVLYPLYVREVKRFERDIQCIEDIKQCGKDLRNRDITLKVLLSSSNVRDETEAIGMCCVQSSHHDWDEMYELYLRNMFYKHEIYPTKLKLLKNIEHVLNCKSINKNASERYLKLLKHLKRELENDIPNGGRDK